MIAKTSLKIASRRIYTVDPLPVYFHEVAGNRILDIFHNGLSVPVTVDEVRGAAYWTETLEEGDEIQVLYTSLPRLGSAAAETMTGFESFGFENFGFL